MLKFYCMKIQENDISIFPKTSTYRVLSARMVPTSQHAVVGWLCWPDTTVDRGMISKLQPPYRIINIVMFVW
jgi:hypothetical protein